LFAGLFFGANLPQQEASAQGRQAFGNGRFQISSYGDTLGDSVHHGCYVLDTSTGQVYHAGLGGAVEKVADRLP
jgi:hypothetical protein